MNVQANRTTHKTTIDLEETKQIAAQALLKN